RDRRGRESLVRPEVRLDREHRAGGLPVTRTRLLAALAPLVASSAACGLIFNLHEPPPCSSDSDCSGGAICFPEGCGDPGKGIRVQVTHGGAAREYAIDQLSATYDQVV